MARTYTVDDKVYEGFDQNFSQPGTIEQVCLVQIEDSVEAFVLESPWKQAGLLQFLVDMYGDLAKPIGVFRR